MITRSDLETLLKTEMHDACRITHKDGSCFVEVEQAARCVITKLRELYSNSDIKKILKGEIDE